MASIEANENFSNLHILVLNDDPKTLKFIKTILNTLGIENVVALDQSIKAIKYIKKNVNVINLIFADIIIAECDGFEMCQHLFHLGYVGPVVFINDTHAFIERGLILLNNHLYQLDIRAVLTPPLKFDDIRKIILELPKKS